MGNDLVNYQARFAEMARAAQEKEKVTGGGRFMSTKSGVLSFNDEPMPGNQVAAIVLSSVFENTYYRNQWKAGVVENPTCYAFGFDEDELAPHPNMEADPEHFEPQAMDCASCPMAEWGSAKQGAGKACQQRRRLYMIPAGFYTQSKNGGWDLELFDTPQDLVDLDPAVLKVPVTSTKNWSKYVHQVSKEFQRPPAGVITRVSLEPDAKTQFQVRFETVDLVPDDFLETVFALMDSANENIIQPYYSSDKEEE